MAEYTVNQLLSMATKLKERKNELRPLVGQSSTVQEHWRGGSENDKVVTKSKYDVVDVDQKIVDIDMALYEIDSQIKQSNAATKVTVDTNKLDFGKLMSAVKSAKTE